ncbi:MAG TPA: alkaline phosphatase D family protein [Actinomycetota bacterium]|nr:alkaline phosphatase D family protein [Actinomycetota bacterium]
MSVFAHAVASFDPTSHSVLLWTRLSGATEARWEMATDPGFRRVVASGVHNTGPERDFTIAVDVGDLKAGTSYWYRFESGEERSPIGRTRTLPEGDVASFTVGLVTCARYSVAPLTVYRAVALADVDLVVHLGDYMYDDPGERSPRRHNPRRHTVTLDDYRARLAQVRLDPDCQALHLRHPMAFVWDDHDFVDNAWLGGAKDHDQEKDGPWPERRDAAVQAHREWVPWRSEETWESLRIYRSLEVGNLVEVLLVDSRLVGRDRQASLPGGKPVDDPSKSLLGKRQWEWLESRLTGDSKRWAVVANGVVVNSIPLWVPFARIFNPLLPGGYIARGGSLVLRDDQWDGYIAERDRLVGLLERRPAGSGTILVSGDVHSSWAFEGPSRRNGVARAVEVVVPAVSSAPMGRTRPPGLWQVVDRTVADMEHVRWVDVTSNGFATLHLSPDEVRSTWWFVNPFDADPAPNCEAGIALRTRRNGAAARWEPFEPDGLPEEVSGDGTGTAEAQLDGLPPRPVDIARMHRWHLRRELCFVAALLGAVASLVMGLAWLGRKLARLL